MQIFENLVYEKAADLFCEHRSVGVTNSNLLAELLGKKHKDLLVVIRSVLENEPALDGRNISPVTYRGANGQDRPMYELDEEGATAVVMETSGPTARDCRIKIRKAFFAFRKYYEENEFNGFVTDSTKQNAVASYAEIEQYMASFMERVVERVESSIDGHLNRIEERLDNLSIPRRDFKAQHKQSASLCCLDRRSGKCPICEKTKIIEESGQWNEVCNFDHIDNNRSNADQLNCLPVCIDCHREKHKLAMYFTRAQAWKASFKEYIEPGNQMELLHGN